LALTDQAITKIKDLIVAGEFGPGARLPREKELAERLGLSRNSLREAVRALTLIGVLEPRQGDGTYVTSLEPDLLLAGTSFVSDLLTGPTLRELYQVRRILEPAATAMAALRLTTAELDALEESLDRMDTAETTQAFIDADVDFHKIIVNACGNATLASLIQNLAGGTMRARVWRAIHERGAVESTRRLHRDIYRALQQRDPELAAAADLVHLAEGESWLHTVIDPAGDGEAPPPAVVS
jgi:GntR family transcriptional regulator, transcriptional repressor for pyruvate dehydrogenase complex